MFALEHARRTHQLAYDRWKASDPGKRPDWDWLRVSPPLPKIEVRDGDPPHAFEAAKKWDAAVDAQRKAAADNYAAWENHRGMIDAGTYDHMMRNPQALETLSRYEVGLYRQLEAALRQYWLVAGSRQRRRAEPPSELIQDISPDEVTPDAAQNPPDCA